MDDLPAPARRTAPFSYQPFGRLTTRLRRSGYRPTLFGEVWAAAGSDGGPEENPEGAAGGAVPSQRIYALRMRMPARSRRVIVRRLAVLVSRRGVRLRFFMLAAIMVMGGLMMMMGGGLVLGGGLMMMLAGRMLGLRHGDVPLGPCGRSASPVFRYYYGETLSTNAPRLKLVHGHFELRRR